MLTRPLSWAEGFHIHCTVEISNHLCQFSLHFLDPLRVDEATHRPLYNHQQLPISEKCRLPTEPPTFDIVARAIRNFLHHFEHSRDRLLQDIGLFVDDLVYDLVRKNQNPLQTIQKVRRHPIVLVLFLQELKYSDVTSVFVAQERTQTSNVTWATLKAAFAISFN